MARDAVQVGQELHGRGDVDLPAELQHRVTAVLVDAQMPGRRCGFLLHDDIASNRLHRRHGVRANPFPALQVTLDGVNLSMFD